MVGLVRRLTVALDGAARELYAAITLATGT
jgi:hypothetical protein